ncbi:MAG: molybdopterin-dependent oxidoreductase [Candidatus Rokubacteria bacterium]|nr:molybdopterin-dependent oxidoreductase [Candidatus Rokubacteria bacterium]
MSDDRVAMDPVGRVVKVPVPFSNLQSWTTPNEHVFVVAHMGIARVEAGRWRLAIGGLVDRPLVLSYEDVLGLPSRTVTALLECAGNPLRPDEPVNRIANVTWKGVVLRTLLTEAGVRPQAKYVWLEGEDYGSFADVYSECYVKDVPLATAMDDGTILAYEMNGVPLSAEHGFPLRALVSGFYGTNSVKWLKRIVLAEKRPESLFTTKLYNRRVEVGHRVVTEPVWELRIKSLIVRPSSRAVLGPGMWLVGGWAWAAAGVAGVEVSTDDGKAWAPAHLEERVGHSWQPFVYPWRVTDRGTYRLLSRATDTSGIVQPAASGPNRWHRVEVTVSERATAPDGDSGS